MAPPLRAWAVIVAGGSGTRFGRRKQFARLAGRPVVAWSIATARGACDGVVVVVPADSGAARPESGATSAERATAAAGAGAPPVDDRDLAAALREVVVVPGGVTRSDSVRAGLAAVPAEADIIAVHDAARPLAGPAVWDAVLAAVRAGADGAIPVVAVADTIRRVTADGTLDVVDRTTLRAVQTPQAFRASALRAAHAAGGDATDDAILVEAQGGRVVLVDGHPANAKITTPGDLLVAAALLPEVLPC